MLRVTGKAQVPLPVACDPDILKPGDVASFPAWRVQFATIGHGKIRTERIHIGMQQGQNPFTAGLQGAGQFLRTSAASLLRS